MKVLFLAPTPYFSLRGTPLAVRRVLQFLSATGCEVEVLTYPFGTDPAMPGVKVIRCAITLRGVLRLDAVPLGPSWQKVVLDLAVFLRLWVRLVRGRLSRRYRYQCIHAVDELTFGCWLLKPLLHSPVIYDMDSSIEEQFEGSRFLRRLRWLARWVERRMVSSAEAVLVVSPELEERVKEIDSTKAVYLLPDRAPVTAAMISSRSGDPSPLDDDLPRPILVYVGNLGAHQGVEELLQAFELERSAGLTCSLIIVGRVDDFVARLQAGGPSATFLGELPPERLASVYGRCDVLVSPRLRGANTPMKVHEYLEAEKLILATRVPGHRLLVGNEAVVWANPDVGGLREGLRTAVGQWRQGRRGCRTPGSKEGSSEPVLEDVYRVVAGFGGDRHEPEKRA